MSNLKICDSTHSLSTTKTVNLFVNKLNKSPVITIPSIGVSFQSLSADLDKDNRLPVITLSDSDSDITPTFNTSFGEKTFPPYSLLLKVTGLGRLTIFNKVYLYYCYLEKKITLLKKKTIFCIVLS